jgi:hypothetical protein
MSQNVLMVILMEAATLANYFIAINKNMNAGVKAGLEMVVAGVQQTSMSLSNPMVSTGTATAGLVAVSGTGVNVGQ